MMAELHFDSGQSEITPELAGLLAGAKETLEENPEWKLRVEGYTDNEGSKAFNAELSKQRAESVTNWLAGHGVDRIDYQQKATARRILLPTIPRRRPRQEQAGRTRPNVAKGEAETSNRSRMAFDYGEHA